jgi:hypothetical protein
MQDPEIAQSMMKIEEFLNSLMSSLDLKMWIILLWKNKKKKCPKKKKIIEEND